jgi:hypothetical protein
VAEIPFDLNRLAAALGGEVSGDQVLAPGPNHSKADRSLAVKPDGTAPDGFLVHSFANDDPIACKRYVRERCGLPPFKANGDRRSSSEVAALLRSAVLSQEQDKPKGVLVATYSYTDRNKSLLYQVSNFTRKRFDSDGRTEMAVGSGSWKTGGFSTDYRNCCNTRMEPCSYAKVRKMPTALPLLAIAQPAWPAAVDERVRSSAGWPGCPDT